MGLPKYIYWLGWLAKSILENLLISIFAIILLIIPFKGDYSVFHYSDTLLLWLLLFVFIVSLSSFSLLVSSFFRSSKRAVTFLSLIFLLSIGPAWSSRDVRSYGILAKFISVLFPTSSFGMSMKLVSIFEGMGQGLQWSNLFSTPKGSAFSVGDLLMVMVFLNIVYLEIAQYVEQVFPGEFGTPKKWYYPIQEIYGKRKDYVELDSASVGVSGSAINCRREEVQGSAVPGITIMNLCKVFENNFVAVNNVSMNIYENEITILLGENGAGKTTTFKMLTGMMDPTSGTAMIKGLDLRRDLKEIRNRIGLCPQHDVLFSQLTVKDHLLFFGQMKGLTKEAAEFEANMFMQRMELSAKAETRSDKLSGGMKRKLNLAISLCGGTQIVFLDEPTSGVDPASRRDIWNILQEMKVDRTILLSTHFMDEADMLGDRVAILNSGVLKCMGSGNYLKTQYRSAYKLVSF